MTTAQLDEATPYRPLRLWPGVLAVVLQWLVRFGLPVVVPTAVPVAVFGGLIGGLLVVLWWAFFSRAPWLDRVAGIALMVVAMIGARQILHESMADGAMGMLFPIYAVPVLSLAFVAWAVVGGSLSPGLRRVTMAATIVLACCGWALVQTYGVSGSFNWDFAWRWADSAEERLLAEAGEQELAPAPAPAEVEAEAEWPGFRGPFRNGVVRGLRIETDWTLSPPVELWRQPIGPGWSSFAVRGDFLYTQEQRGEDEIVACYSAKSGEPVWMHRDAVRFWEAMAGAGPRATPTVIDGRVYAFGATGILNVLEASSGARVWSRDVAADAGAEVPGWGFASSPLVTGDQVVVAVAGQLVAYDRAGGEPRWVGEAHGESYSSPHMAMLDGVRQVLLMTGRGLISVEPSDGTRLWEHSWPGFHSLQPTLIGDGDLLLASSGSAGGLGTRRVTVSHGPGGWNVEERWTSNGLKPYFNDLVIHQGHAFGFDGRILASIDLGDGSRKWKGGRYGHGQLVLLADQGLLLVLSEKGELALVAATPDEYTELARIPAIAGKTWNHPVVVGDLLLVRNGAEMVAFRLPVAST